MISYQRSTGTWLVDMTKLRWRIERDYQDLKQEVGLGHFEGRVRVSGDREHGFQCIVSTDFAGS